MKQKADRDRIRNLYFRLILPVILTISAFIISMYLIFIPALEKNLVDQKKDMLRELTQSALGVLENLDKQVRSGESGLEEAQKEAIGLIQMLRYGRESKDYFWVTDMKPFMVVHPYRPDLNGMNLEDYKDPNGKKLFVESVSVVQEKGEGFIDYYWQWKDDSSRIVPKLSFVKGFEPWGWVVGTGIYMNDVEDEINRTKKNLTIVSIIIILIIAVLMVYILRTGLLIESKRQNAVEALQESRERYRSLVEASNDGTMLSIDGKISYANPFFLDMFGFEDEDILGKDPEMVFDKGDEDALRSFREFMEKDSGIIKIETEMAGKNGYSRPVLLTISRAAFGDKKASIFVASELSGKQKLQKQIDQLGEELQTSLLLMNQPVKLIARSPMAISMNATIKNCAELMSRKNQNGVLISGQKGEYLGIVTDQDLRHRVVAKGMNYNDPVYTIMSSPVISIPDNSLLFEALISLQQNKVTHIALKDSNGRFTGLVSHVELLHMQQNTTAYLMREIGNAEHADELVEYSRKTRGIVKVLEEGGAKTSNITRIITSVTDALTGKFVELAIKEKGKPPAEFVFIALGSEGRGEQTLATDQDNGIIFRDPDDSHREERVNYFLAIGKKVNEWMDQSGYNLCKGEVMAGNPKWCKPLTEWKINFGKWINQAEPQAVMEASIFFDFRPVYGDFTITDELQEYVDHAIANKEPFFYQMASQALKFNASTDVSSLFQVDKVSGRRQFDSKKIIFTITSFARIYALQNQVRARSTLDRLTSLNQSEMLAEELFERISDGYDFLMMLRFRAQLKAISGNIEVTNLVPDEILSELDFTHLKKVLGTVAEIQTKVKMDFNIN